MSPDGGAKSSNPSRSDSERLSLLGKNAAHKRYPSEDKWTSLIFPLRSLLSDVYIFINALVRIPPTRIQIIRSYLHSTKNEFPMRTIIKKT